jgi:hypothetical protein
LGLLLPLYGAPRLLPTQSNDRVRFRRRWFPLRRTRQNRFNVQCLRDSLEHWVRGPEGVAGIVQRRKHSLSVGLVILRIDRKVCYGFVGSVLLDRAFCQTHA